MPDSFVIARAQDAARDAYDHHFATWTPSVEDGQDDYVDREQEAVDRAAEAAIRTLLQHLGRREMNFGKGGITGPAVGIAEIDSLLEEIGNA